jgi:hypothetical protein
MAVSCENANCHSVTVRDLTRLSQKSSRIQRFYNYFKFFQNHYPPQEVKLLWLHCIHLLPCVSPLQSSVNGASMHRSLPPGPLRSIGDCFTWMSVKPPPDYFFASDLDLWPVHRVLFFFMAIKYSHGHLIIDRADIGHTSPLYTTTAFFSVLSILFSHN